MKFPRSETGAVLGGWVINTAYLQRIKSELDKVPEHYNLCWEQIEEVLLALEKLSDEPDSAHETSGSPWQPIETAPKDGRTLLLGYFNSHGKWRSLHGQWFPEGSMDEWDGPDYTNPAGWYETSIENDDPPNCWATEPTHWHPTLRPPEKASDEPAGSHCPHCGDDH